jgi:hypothetical protein
MKHVRHSSRPGLLVSLIALALVGATSAAAATSDQPTPGKEA